MFHPSAVGLRRRGVDLRTVADQLRSFQLVQWHRVPPAQERTDETKCKPGKADLFVYLVVVAQPGEQNALWPWLHIPLGPGFLQQRFSLNKYGSLNEDLGCRSIIHTALEG